MSLYSKRISQQKSHLEAAFEARDLLDFTMRGDATAVQLLIQMLPFMNARMQGLYKLGRAAHADPIPFALKGGMVATASLFLWTFNKDDDRWKELEDWDKWTYYHFWIGKDHYRIPKPFEIGALFSSLWESAAETIAGDEDIGFFADFLQFMMMDAFALNPFPQLVRPAMEQWANKSFFTGRPIESERLQNLRPGERFDPWTSKTLQLAGKWGIPPKRAEALIQGYFATVGTLGLSIADSMTHYLGDFPENPTKEMKDYPVIGRFMRGEEIPRTTKYVTRFYEIMQEIDQFVGTVNLYKNTGNYKRAREIMTENRGYLMLKAPLNTVRTDLREVNANIRKVYQSNMEPDKKRDMLNRFTKYRNDKVKLAYSLIEKAKKREKELSTPAFGPKPPQK